MALFEVLTWQKEMRNFSFTPVIHLSATRLYYYVEFGGFFSFFDQRHKQDVALRHLLLLPPTFISPLFTHLSDLCDLM
jgi:hypothetical protein